MNHEAFEGLMVLTAISAACALILHSVWPRYGWASVSSGILSAVLFQAANAVHLGYLDPFLPVALFFSAPLGIGIALVIGLPFRKKRQRAPGPGRVPAHGASQSVLMLLRVINMVVSGIILAENLFFLFVALLSYGYQAPGLENIFFHYLLGLSFFFCLSAGLSILGKARGRKGLLWAAGLAWLGLLLRILIASDYFYYYNTHLGILLVASVFIFIFYTRRNVKEIF